VTTTLIYTTYADMHSMAARKEKGVHIYRIWDPDPLSHHGAIATDKRKEREYELSIILSLLRYL
jgi:hypothetical protein